MLLFLLWVVVCSDLCIHAMNKCSYSVREFFGARSFRGIPGFVRGYVQFCTSIGRLPAGYQIPEQSLTLASVFSNLCQEQFMIMIHVILVQ